MTGGLFRFLLEAAGDPRLIAATPNAVTYEGLANDGQDVVRPSARVADTYRQATLGFVAAPHWDLR